MKRLTATFLLLGVGTAAQADLCADIRALDASSQEPVLELTTAGPPPKCTRSLMLSGGVQLHCGWAFAYRASEAKDAFEGLIAEVTECFGDDARVTSDLDVNHPDFYDLQTFQLGGQEIGVSLKDKAALAETYVFLRVTLPE